jgi:hypothetical protein
MLYIDHSSTKVQNIIAAQARLRTARNEAQLEVWRMGKRAPQYKLRALDALLHAELHLSEEIRTDLSCWVDGGN